MHAVSAVEIDPQARLSEPLVEQILTRLGWSHRPEVTLAGLAELYAAWGTKVPFDNVRKLIRVKNGDPGPFPGSTPEDFFTAWLQHGTGGTCWAGNGSFHALLTALGFPAVRGVATMLAAPNIPPNHGTVQVIFDEQRYLVDCSMIHGEPLRLDPGAITEIRHPARGLRCEPRADGRWWIAWRPLHKLDGFDCRLEFFGAEAREFRERYESTREWSPFNYEVCARINRGEEVKGIAFGRAVTLRADGQADSHPVSRDERDRCLVEDVGLSEEIVAQLPADAPTPPPPGSRTAAAQTSAD